MVKIVQFIFFGNYFYGLCAVALAIEASLQQQQPLNDAVFYILIFLSVIVYYTVAYTDDTTPRRSNLRSIWYANHQPITQITQTVFSLMVAGLLAWFLWRHHQHIGILTVADWLLALFFPLAGIFYYGVGSGKFGINWLNKNKPAVSPKNKYNLRQIGWLKPFIIGISWAGIANIYPMLYHSVCNNIPFDISLVGILLFIKNFMFVSVLCIMFDIKDYADDANQRIKTFVTKVGLRKTIFYILIPLVLLGLGSFWAYGLMHQFSWMKILLNTIPFAALLVVAYSMHRRQSIMYYLIIIDGLMLVKAVCGSIAARWY